MRVVYLGAGWPNAVNFPVHLRDNPTLIGRRNMPKDLTSFLQGAEVFVSYDRETTLLAAATAAGCPAMVVQDDGSLASWSAPQ